MAGLSSIDIAYVRPEVATQVLEIDELISWLLLSSSKHRLALTDGQTPTLARLERPRPPSPCFRTDAVLPDRLLVDGRSESSYQ